MVTIESCVPPNSGYILTSQSQDWLGWDCFVEGQILVLLLECIRPLFVQWIPRKSLEKWEILFLKSLLNLTHKQWIFWNADVHHKIDGLMQQQHMELFSCIWILMETASSDLPPCHCHLLDKKFLNLGNAEKIQQQLLIASMESALSAAFRATTGQVRPGSMSIFNKCSSSAHPQRSINHHSQTTTRPRPNPPRHPQQQTLPASFWILPGARPNRMSPQYAHNTNLTGSHYHLHWKRK